MSQLIPINSLRYEELESKLTALGEPKYRAGQIFKWLSLGVGSFDEMTDIGKALRAKLAEHFLHIEYRDNKKTGVPSGRHD